jgi:hypothetical protein
MKPPKRAIDKDQNTIQRNLFGILDKNKSIEILRFEIRLSHSDKMKEILKEAGFDLNPTFKNIFKKDLCQKIVKLYWNKLFSGNLFLFNAYNNPQKILQMILAKYPRTKTKTAVLLVGLNLLCKDDDGFSGFRKIIKGYKNRNDWYNLKRYLEKLSNGFFAEPIHGYIYDIERSINEFSAYKIKR